MPDAPGPIAASVIIPTFNRKDLLRDAMKSAYAQTVPVEVIVMDDGSPDGTGEMVKSEFPNARYENRGAGNGPSILRNAGIRLARSNFCFPIDDDAVFVSPNTVEQTLRDFEHPRVGAVGIPFINIRKDPTKLILQRSPGPEVYVTLAYVGAAHAVRRDVFLAAGGYREHFYYMGEEGDVCLRMLAAGYVTRVGQADPMHHFESPSRSHKRADLYGRRNDVLYVWHNVPARSLLPHLFGTTLNGVRFGFRVGRPLRMMQGLAWGYVGIPGQLSDRKPVSREVYTLSRELKKRDVVPLAEIEHRLPPPREIRFAPDGTPVGFAG